MKFVSHIKHILFICVILCVTVLPVKGERSTLHKLQSLGMIVAADTIPQQKKQKPDVKKQQPDKKGPEKAKVKEVPKARPQQRPKVVTPKAKPIKVIKPKVGRKV